MEFDGECWGCGGELDSPDEMMVCPLCNRRICISCACYHELEDVECCEDCGYQEDEF